MCIQSVRDPTPGLHICLRSWLTDSPQCPSPVSRVEPIDRCVSGQMWWHGRYDQHIERIHFTELPMWRKETDVHNFVSRWCQMIVLILGWSTWWTSLVFCLWSKLQLLFWMRKLKYDCLSWEHISNGYVNPWDLLNNFCFYVLTQKLLFVMLSVVTCHMWNA